MRAAVLVVSDSAAAGEREDAGGPLLAKLLGDLGAEVTAVEVVPDTQAAITTWLRRVCAAGDVDVVLTTGGTGFGPRDVTPEATSRVIERPAPGIAEALRAVGLQHTPHAMLSRAVAGIAGHTLIVNMPGSPRALREQWEVLGAALPHAVELLRGGQPH